MKTLKKIYTYILIIIPAIVFSQNELLALNYFEKGDFEKALINYEQLLKVQDSNPFYFSKTIECYQQLNQFEKAEKTINSRYDKYKQASLLIELGYNYQLQKDQIKATKYYNQAIDRIRKNTNEIYNIANVFEKKSLNDWALQAYELATNLDSKMNFNYQMALLYGQNGNTELMIDKFLTESFNNPQMLSAIQYQLSLYLTDNSTENFKNQLKKALLINTQKNQDIFWNQYLSWYFVQQKEYNKAFIQQKAIYKRNPESFYNIINLALMAIDDNDTQTATDIYNFILENTLDKQLKIDANYYLQKINIDKAITDNDNTVIATNLNKLLQEFGTNILTLKLQILQAHFTAFNLKNPELAKTILKKSLELPLNPYQIGDIKMELADIYLFQEKFNQALLYYTQIEDELKNDTTGQEASFKIAKTSYFQTDFIWANKQLKELKTAATQLIANDAIDLYLLIADNTVADSTQTALKKFAHADFLTFQNKNQDALTAFQSILKENQQSEIIPITLLRIGKIYEKQLNFNQALIQYQNIITQYNDSIYTDEAYYYTAEIYNEQLKDPEKAKTNYQNIIFNHQDSIYYTDAQRKFRQLRGDKDL